MLSTLGMLSTLRMLPTLSMLRTLCHLCIHKHRQVERPHALAVQHILQRLRQLLQRRAVANQPCSLGAVLQPQQQVAAQGAGDSVLQLRQHSTA